MFSSSRQNEHVVENIINGLGPTSHNVPFPCSICSKNVNKKGVLCDQCDKWIHIDCNNISNSDTLETDSVLLGSNDIDMPSITDTLPSFEIVSQLTNLPNLFDYDPDENLNTNITSQYTTVQEVASMKLSDKNFTLFHMNN